MKEQDLQNKTLKKLVEIYNNYANKAIKRFPDRKTGIRRVMEAYIAHTSKKKDPIKTAQNVVYSKFHGLTNKEVSETNTFKLMCANCGIEPTIRQASKFRNGKGLLHAHMEA